MGDADRGGDARRPLGRHDDTAGADRLQHLLGDVGRLVQLAVAKDDRELITAESSDEVELADAATQQPTDVCDQVIADRVAEAVVDRLETVEIEHQQCRVLVVSARDLDHPFQLRLEAPAIVQACQRVVFGHVAQLLFEAAALADVHDLGHGVGHRGAVQTRHRSRAHVCPDERAVLTDEALLDDDRLVGP